VEVVWRRAVALLSLKRDKEVVVSKVLYRHYMTKRVRGRMRGTRWGHGVLPCRPRAMEVT
jgi:hypothetical protein